MSSGSAIDWETIAKGMIDGTTQFTIDEAAAEAITATNIGMRFFYYRTNLIGDVILPPTLTQITGAEVFFGCTNVHSITVGENVTTIRNDVFRGMGNNMKALIINRVTPPTLTGTNAFLSTDACIVYVPDSAVNDYKTANYWDAYASRIKGISELPTT